MLSELDVLFLCPLWVVVALAIVQINEELDDLALVSLHGLLLLVIEVDA